MRYLYLLATMLDVDDQGEIERALASSRLAYENLERLGASCHHAHEEYLRLVRERDRAVVGVARWGYSHRALAAAAHVTPQRVAQILVRAQRGRPKAVPAEVVAGGRLAKPPRSRPHRT